jgi:para-nitrobenzyl esterase
MKYWSKHMSSTLVETQYGKVQGTADGDVSVWKGIPFAQPPLGELRFHAPRKPVSWSGVRDATAFGAISAQPAAIMGFFSAKPELSSEDSLFLNIWSPDADDRRRPVLFWIHGGAFTAGSGSTAWYDGKAFASNGDVVVVTINYRLGALGFLHLADVEGTDAGFASNCGLLDQIAALEWVRDNIAAFGGDPANITLFGESAGAMSIGTLLAMPEAKGLYQRAILQSGASHNVRTSEKATTITHAFMNALNVQKATDLLSVPLEQLLEVQSTITVPGGGLPFEPVIDGKTLPQAPIDAIAHGSADGISLLIGTNRDEMRLFTLMDPNEAVFKMPLLEKLFGEKAEQVAALYEANAATREDAWIDILTDRTFRIPALSLANRALERGTPVWMYRFDWSSPAFGGQLKACHALEVPFVWNNLDKQGVEMLTGDSPMRQKIAEDMHAAWIAFAHTGKPATSDLPTWPVYDADRRATMLFNEAYEVVNDPQGTERRAWEESVSAAL